MKRIFAHLFDRGGLCETLRYVSLLVLAVFASQSQALTAIPGTRLSVELPPEFQLAEDFTGILWREAGTSILAAELPTPASRMQAGLTKEALAGRGITLRRRETVAAGIGEAVLIEATQSAHGLEMHKWILVGGDARNTIMITGSVPASLGPQIGPTVRSVLLGAKWDPTLETAKSAAFAFDFVETADLKVARNLGGAIVMTRDGAEDERSPVGPAVVISRTTSAAAITDLAVFAQRRLAETRTLTAGEVREEAAIVVSGLTAHEIVANGEAKNGSPIVVYQLVAYDGTHVVIVLALTDPALEARYLPQFREIARSLRPR